jgi:FkbM family methyltransferase
MILPWPDLVKKYALDEKVTGVIHCGAHFAEEATLYHAAGIKNVWWIEANSDLLPIVHQNTMDYGHHVIEALLGPTDDEWMVFHITNYDGMSSSVLEFGTHPNFSPDTQFVSEQRHLSKTLDTLVREFEILDCNMLVMDLQGFEGPVLQGAIGLIPHLDFVMSEVNNDEVYKGCTKIWDLDSILSGFERVETDWVGNQGWGDALWVRR